MDTPDKLREPTANEPKAVKGPETLKELIGTRGIVPWFVYLGGAALFVAVYVALLAAPFALVSNPS